MPAANAKGRNNFYEFGTGKDEPAKNAPKWKPNPAWTVKLEGSVKKPVTLDLAGIMKLGLEERIYRMRCVERWSMVIPWIGIPLAAVLKQVELTRASAFRKRFLPPHGTSTAPASTGFTPT